MDQTVFLKHCPLFYLPSILMRNRHLAGEISMYVEQLLMFTTHGRQIIDFVINMKSFHQFLLDNSISPEVISKIPTTVIEWDQTKRVGTILSLVLMNLLQHDLSYSQIFTLFKHCHLKDIFGEDGPMKCAIQELLKDIVKKQSQSKGTLSGPLMISENLAEELDEIDPAVYGVFESDTMIGFIFSKVFVYLKQLKGVVFEPNRLWPITDEKMSRVVRRKVSAQLEECLPALKAGYKIERPSAPFWDTVTLNFCQRSVKEYVTVANLKSALANNSCVDSNIQMEAEMYGVPAPVWNIVVRAVPLRQHLLDLTFKYFSSKEEHFNPFQMMMMQNLFAQSLLSVAKETPRKQQISKGRAQKPTYLPKKDDNKRRAGAADRGKNSTPDVNKEDIKLSGKDEIEELAREGYAQVNMGNFAAAANVYEELAKKLESISRSKHDDVSTTQPLTPDHVTFARIFCLHRSSQDKLILRLVIDKCLVEGCSTLWHYCRAFFSAEKFDFDEAKKAASLVDKEKVLQEELPKWPQQQNMIDVLTFSRTNCNYTPGELQKVFDERMDLFLNPPKPLAVCVSAKCGFSRREIFKGDPSEGDCVYFSECTHSCKLDYHWACWKKFKLQDNAVIGSNCFTPDCTGKVKLIVLLEVGTGKERKRMRQEVQSAAGEAKGKQNKKPKNKKIPSGSSVSDSKPGDPKQDTNQRPQQPRATMPEPIKSSGAHMEENKPVVLTGSDMPVPDMLPDDKLVLLNPARQVGSSTTLDARGGAIPKRKRNAKSEAENMLASNLFAPLVDDHAESDSKFVGKAEQRQIYGFADKFDSDSDSDIDLSAIVGGKEQRQFGEDENDPFEKLTENHRFIFREFKDLLKKHGPMRSTDIPFIQTFETVKQVEDCNVLLEFEYDDDIVTFLSNSRNFRCDLDSSTISLSYQRIPGGDWEWQAVPTKEEKERRRQQEDMSGRNSSVSLEEMGVATGGRREYTMPLRIKPQKTHKTYNNFNKNQPRDFKTEPVKPKTKSATPIMSISPQTFHRSFSPEHLTHPFQNEPKRAPPQDRPIQETIRLRRTKNSMQSSFDSQFGQQSYPSVHKSEHVDFEGDDNNNLIGYDSRPDSVASFSGSFADQGFESPDHRSQDYDDINKMRSFSDYNEVPYPIQQHPPTIQTPSGPANTPVIDPNLIMQMLQTMGLRQGFVPQNHNPMLPNTQVTSHHLTSAGFGRNEVTGVTPMSAAEKERREMMTLLSGADYLED